MIARRYFIANVSNLILTACQDGCTGSLFERVDSMSASLDRLDVTGLVPLPWAGLFHYENTTVLLDRALVDKRVNHQTVERIATAHAPDLLPAAYILLQRVELVSLFNSDMSV